MLYLLCIGPCTEDEFRCPLFLVSQTPTCVTLSLTVMMDLMSRTVVQVRTFHPTRFFGM